MHPLLLQHHRHLYTSLIMPIFATSQLLTSCSPSSLLPRPFRSTLPPFPPTAAGTPPACRAFSMARPPAPRPRPNGSPPVPLPPSHLLSRKVHLQSLENQSSDSSRLAVLKSRLLEEGIDCDDCKAGEYYHILCPRCDGGDTRERSLSLYIRGDCDLATWTCYRLECEWKGSARATVDVKRYRSNDNHHKNESFRVITEEDICLEPLCNELVAYFDRRKISRETLRRNGVMQRICADNQPAIAFAYRRDGKLVNCKYRDSAKNFWQELGTEKIFYGLDDIKNTSDIIIVEGEMDKLSMEEAGFRNCVSVPDGAPSKVSSKETPSEEEDTKYKYVWSCKEYLNEASRIILATDADTPGQALAEELARRLGRERCWRVNWPKKSDTEVCKDANEVLMCVGLDALKNVIDNAEPYPIRGLLQFQQFFNDIDAYYNSSLEYELGVSTGWRNVDDLYRVVPGELSIISGIPNSGKSEWIDALLVNINEKTLWKFALCSMENKVRDHARKLLEKHVKKPFFNASYGQSVERMSIEELEQGKQWLNQTFHLIRCEDDSLPSIEWVLNLAKAAVMRYGIRGLVIDPYNELDHQRNLRLTETEYVSRMLTKVKRFAQHHSCHVWFVAHPRQLHQWSGGPPNMYDISGSAHFINKCDNGIVIHRNRDPAKGPLDHVQVCVRKVRNKLVGRIGDTFLKYDRTTGVFADDDDFRNQTNVVPEEQL